MEEKQVTPKIRKRRVKGPSKTRYRLFRQAFAYAVPVFIIIWIIAVVLRVNLNAVNISQASIDDFEVTDLVHSRAESRQAVSDIVNEHIVIINSGNLKRLQYALLLDSIRLYHPAVIGMDVLFPRLLQTEADTLLQRSLAGGPPLVFASRFHHLPDSSYKVRTHSFFQVQQEGHINFSSLDDPFTVVRKFEPVRIEKSDTSYAFAVKVAGLVEPDIYEVLRGKEQKELPIWYSGTVDNFMVIQADSVLAKAQFYASFLRDKIVLIGDATTPQHNTTYSLRDKFYTPMNARPFGKSYPDAPGVLVHANIIAMLFERNFIRVVPDGFSLVFSFLLCYLLIAFIFYLEKRAPLSSGFWVKLAQLVLALLFIFLSLFLHEQFKIKMQVDHYLIVVVLCAEALAAVQILNRMRLQKFKKW